MGNFEAKGKLERSPWRQLSTFVEIKQQLQRGWPE